jgi:diguanylate cyclase (GGDEF)-like protein
MPATTEAERLRAILALQTAVNGADLDARDVMRLVADAACDLTGAAGAAVELAEGDELVYRAATGTVAALLGRRESATSSRSGACLRTAEPQADGHGIAVPIVHRGGAVGTIEIVSDEAGALGAIDIDTLQVLAGFVAQVVRDSVELADDERRAMLDGLTGLANRSLLNDRLEQAVARAHRHGTSVGVLYLDLDRFAEVNEQHGVAAGDEALIVVGHRLLAAIRTSDTAARVGGDEFVVLCEPLVDTTHLAILARRLEAAICAPIEVARGAIRLGVSIGAAVTTGEKADGIELLRCADAAMFRNKQTPATVR